MQENKIFRGIVTLIAAATLASTLTGAVPASAATASLSFSQTRFSDTLSNSATVSVSLSNTRGVQSMLITCGTYFTAFSIPDYKNVLLTANGLGKYLSASGSRPLTKLLYNSKGQAYYATTSVSFTFPLGFGKDSMAQSGSCSPSVQIRDIDDKYTYIQSSVTLSFVKGGTSNPKPATSPTPSPIPTPESAPNSGDSSSFSNVNYGPGFPCRYDLRDSGEQEIEDWRDVDTNLLPRIWLDQVPIVCTDLKNFSSARLSSWTSVKIPSKATEFIDWMSRFHPQKSLATCQAIFNSSTSESQRSLLRKNAAALCDSVPGRWRYDISTKVEDWRVSTSSGIEPQVSIDFRNNVSRPLEATNPTSVESPSTSPGSMSPQSGEFSAWTKVLTNGKQIKFYVKYPHVGDKIQFMVQDSSGTYRQLAWIRIDVEDLGVDGNYQGLTNDIYFIRTLNLIPGKNRVQIRVNGETVWGTKTYSLK